MRDWIERWRQGPVERHADDVRRLLGWGRELLLSPRSTAAERYDQVCEAVSAGMIGEPSTADLQRIEGLYQETGEVQRAEVRNLAETFHESLSGVVEGLRQGLSADEDAIDELETLEANLRQARNSRDLADVQRALNQEVSRLTQIVAKQVQSRERLRSQYEQAVGTLHERLQQAETSLQTDPLTRLGNRTAYEFYAAALFQRVKDGQTRAALAVLDLDGFKSVNDQYGHAAGDRVLAAVALRLQEALPAGAFLARLGGDEFVAVVKGDPRSLETALTKADRRLSTRPVHLRDQEEARVGLSFGVVALGTGTSAQADFEEADRRMYAAKAARKAARRAA